MVEALFEEGRVEFSCKGGIGEVTLQPYVRTFGVGLGGELQVVQMVGRRVSTFGRNVQVGEHDFAEGVLEIEGVERGFQLGAECAGECLVVESKLCGSEVANVELQVDCGGTAVGGKMTGELAGEIGTGVAAV